MDSYKESFTKWHKHQINILATDKNILPQISQNRCKVLYCVAREAFNGGRSCTVHKGEVYDFSCAHMCLKAKYKRTDK